MVVLVEGDGVLKLQTIVRNTIEKNLCLHSYGAVEVVGIGVVLKSIKLQSSTFEVLENTLNSRCSCSWLISGAKIQIDSLQ